MTEELQQKTDESGNEFADIVEEFYQCYCDALTRRSYHHQPIQVLDRHHPEGNVRPSYPLQGNLRSQWKAPLIAIADPEEAATAVNAALIDERFGDVSGTLAISPDIEDELRGAPPSDASRRALELLPKVFGAPDPIYDSRTSSLVKLQQYAYPLWRYDDIIIDHKAPSLEESLLYLARFYEHALHFVLYLPMVDTLSVISLGRIGIAHPLDKTEMEQAAAILSALPAGKTFDFRKMVKTLSLDWPEYTLARRGYAPEHREAYDAMMSAIEEACLMNGAIASRLGEGAVTGEREDPDTIAKSMKRALEEANVDVLMEGMAKGVPLADMMVAFPSAPVPPKKPEWL